MTLWFVLAAMTAAAVFAVLWPLGHRAPASAGSDVDVYRDQLAEIDRDQANGLIGEREAEAARVEVSRRLIAAADTVAPPRAGGTARRRRATALAALVLLPLGAAGLYLVLGSPHLPGQPQAARYNAPVEERSIETLIARVEAHLETNPEDGRGWEVVSPVYMRLGRFDDAVKARRNVLRLLGANATREADLGESLIGAANGIVTADAKAAFERALVHDPGDFRSRYFLGLAAEQDGAHTQAGEIWRGLLSQAPEDAPWIGLVRQSLARVDPNAAAAKAPIRGPTAEDVAAAGQLSAEQRAEMVRGMVERLAERLTREGSDVEGWLRLVRAYMVLGDRDKAASAANDARRALANEPDKLRRVEELAQGLGLKG
jgi:cytochrome c-type biogenesis protein CcmH